MDKIQSEIGCPHYSNTLRVCTLIISFTNLNCPIIHSIWTNRFIPQINASTVKANCKFSCNKCQCENKNRYLAPITQGLEYCIWVWSPYPRQYMFALREQNIYLKCQICWEERLNRLCLYSPQLRNDRQSYWSIHSL